jgi:epoxyqueuosine reductase
MNRIACVSFPSSPTTLTNATLTRMAATLPMNPNDADCRRAESTRFVKDAVRAEGFDEVGITRATMGLGSELLKAWIADGRHGDMSYMADHLEARTDPDQVLEGVKSVVVIALNYKSDDPTPAGRGEVRISRYAWGRDYHDVIRGKLNAAVHRLQPLFPSDQFRGVVDSAPFMERDYARLAGLGWFGKNTLLLNRKLGSLFFLGALLTTAELEPDAPFEADHCGSCRKCLDACPTQAFDGPYQLDPRRCISYLTIEHRGAVDDDLSPQMGEWIFGCDVCQDVCPWNRKAPTTNIAEFRPTPDLDPLPLATILAMDDAEFRRQFRGTPLFRAKRRRLVRNALIAVVNQRLSELKPAVESLAEDADELVRQTARWALDRLNGALSNELH